MIPATRILRANDDSPNPDGKWVLYWMTAYRRTRYNFALEHASELAAQFGRPLVILEAVRQDYPWACDRFHRFLLDGMIDNQKALTKKPVTYYPFLETPQTPGRGLIETLSQQSVAVVTDDFPCFFYPAMYARLAKRLSVSMEIVDGCGLLPIRTSGRLFTVAHSYRRYMQKEWFASVPTFPQEDPLLGKRLPISPPLPPDILTRWPMANLSLFQDRSRSLDLFPINHHIGITPLVGGSAAARTLLSDFMAKRYSKYDTARNEPDTADGSTQLSPHLHFGHISPHELFHAIAHAENWSPERMKKPQGKVHGFWGMREHGEALLDQLATWREIGFNACVQDPHYDRYDSLPDWAQRTLAEHATDPREYQYSLEEWDHAKTHDPLWNAAQRQLVREGRIHNYLRMLWGKKILHWSRTPQEALDVMIELNNRYALDGRDPNSYSGIFWTLGRYDRAWGPERPIFGKVRYMTSDSTARKFSVKKYLERYR